MADKHTASSKTESPVDSRKDGFRTPSPIPHARQDRPLFPERYAHPISRRHNKHILTPLKRRVSSAAARRVSRARVAAAVSLVVLGAA